MNRQVYREMFSQRIGASTVLTFRAVRILDGLGLFDRESVVAWLNRQSTRNTRSLGAKTYYEICAAMGMAVPAQAPATLGAKLRAAEARIAELESALKRIRDCDWVISLPDRMDAVRAIARGVLQ